MVPIRNVLWSLIICSQTIQTLVQGAKLMDTKSTENIFQSSDAYKMRSYIWPLNVRRKVQSTLNSSRLNMKDFRQVYSACLNLRQPIPALIEDGDYIIDQPEFCTGRRSQTWLLVAVHSHPRHVHRRNMIRSTWGSMNRVGKRKIALIFVLGNSGSAEIERAVREENELYRDILQRNFVDDYRNLTRKHFTLFEWLVEGNCLNLSYLVKVDDDTFVDLFHLVNLIESQPSLFQGQFYCSATSGAKPSRTNSKENSKWIVSKAEFSGEEYPAYCEGLGYVVDPSILPQIYWCSMFQPFMWIDDVYMTGVLAQLLKIPRIRFVDGHSYNRIEPNMEQGRFSDFVFLTSYYSEFLPNSFRKLWSASIKNSFPIASN